MAPHLVIREPQSGLAARALLLPAKAPAVVELISNWLSEARTTEAVHAMWTGPEISAQIRSSELDATVRATTPPVQNATILPQPGEIVFLRIGEHAWDGAPDPVFDLGIFYGERARLFFPVGWLQGSVFARVVPEDRAGLAASCALIRDKGRTRLQWSLES